jgi:hypothetical protein
MEWFDAAGVYAVRQVLDIRIRDDTDSGVVVALIELRVYEALARRNLGD